MNGKVIGYIRVSSVDQNSDRQLENLKLDKVFIDRCSGKDIKRPALEEMLGYVRDGDKIIVHSIDRLARNLDDLRNLVNQLNSKQVVIEFIKENLKFTGDDSAMSNLLLSVMGAFAEFEHALIKERQMEGIAKAKARGVYKREKSLTNEQIANIKQRISQETQTMQVNKTRLAKEFGISRQTLYHYLKQYS